MAHEYDHLKTKSTDELKNIFTQYTLANVYYIDYTDPSIINNVDKHFNALLIILERNEFILINKKEIFEVLSHFLVQKAYIQFGSKNKDEKNELIKIYTKIINNYNKSFFNFLQIFDFALVSYFLEDKKLFKKILEDIDLFLKIYNDNVHIIYIEYCYKIKIKHFSYSNICNFIEEHMLECLYKRPESYFEILEKEKFNVLLNTCLSNMVFIKTIMYACSKSKSIIDNKNLSLLIRYSTESHSILNFITNNTGYIKMLNIEFIKEFSKEYIIQFTNINFVIKLYLDNKNPPTKEIIDILYSKLLQNHWAYTRGNNGSKNKKKDLEFVSKIITMLDEYGYSLELDDIKKFIEYKLEFPCVEKYNFKFDVDFIKECQKHDFFPYGIKLTDSKEIYENEFIKGKNTSLLKKLSKKYTYNKKCLDNLCSAKACPQKMLHQIIDSGIKPDFATLCYRLVKENDKVTLTILKSYVETIDHKTFEGHEELYTKLTGKKYPAFE